MESLWRQTIPVTLETSLERVVFPDPGIPQKIINFDMFLFPLILINDDFFSRFVF